MSKKLESKAKKSKLTKLVSRLIDSFQNLKLKNQQTSPSRNKSKSKNFDTKPGIEQGKSNSIHSKEDVFVCDSIAEENNSRLTDTKSSQLSDDPVLEKCDEVKASCLHKNKEIEPIVSVQSAITPVTSENKLKLNSILTDKSLNEESEYKIVSLFGNRRIKSEPVDDQDDDSKILYASWGNKCKDSDKFLDEYSNHQNLTCLENRNIKDEETDNVNYKLEPESDEEDIIERGADKTFKNKERHSEYPSRNRHPRPAVLNDENIEEANYIEIDRRIAELVIERRIVHLEIERIIADIENERIIADIENERIIPDIENENRIAQILAFDREMINVFCGLFGPKNNNFFQSTDSRLSPAINSQLRTEARDNIVVSEMFSKERYFEECLGMKTEVEEPDFFSNGNKVIHYFKPYGKRKYKRTNLHDAVINENLERTLCIVEIHKWFHNHLFEINSKDSSNPKKTVLDWAYETRNTLLINYLKENLATCAVSINAPGN